MTLNPPSQAPVAALQGYATEEGTARWAGRLTKADPSHIRSLQGLSVSSIGLGTYLGDADEQTDENYAQALRQAIAGGSNVVDTAINYRCQRSERAIGAELSRLCAEQAVRRDEVVVATKGGYLPFDGQVPEDPGRYVVDTFINPGLAPYDDIVAGCHCISPSYLSHAIETSLRNLRLETLDIYYLHNPEQQLDQVSRDRFLKRLEQAFVFLEQRVQQGAIRRYGIATWNGLRANPESREYLSLEEITSAAQRAGGTGHHFRVIQLPYNLAMPEAVAFQNQSVQGRMRTALEAAQDLGLSVMVSASLLQSRLSKLPRPFVEHIPGLDTDAQRAVQFVRSTPGVTCSLVGMKSRAHVEENLILAQRPLLPQQQLTRLFERGPRRQG